MKSQVTLISGGKVWKVRHVYTLIRFHLICSCFDFWCCQVHCLCVCMHWNWKLVRFGFDPHLHCLNYAITLRIDSPWRTWSYVLYVSPYPRVFGVLDHLSYCFCRLPSRYRFIPFVWRASQGFFGVFYVCHSQKRLFSCWYRGMKALVTCHCLYVPLRVCRAGFWTFWEA